VAGRPPKPTALKRLRGELRPSRLNRNEPQPPVGAEPPPWLTKAARRRWALLAPILLDMRVLTRADAVALGNTCELLAAFHRQCKEGRPTSNLAGEIRQHLGRFGLTPADRARITSAPPVVDDPFESFDGKLKVVKGGKVNG
jgi:hypothetical protein